MDIVNVTKWYRPYDMVHVLCTIHRARVEPLCYDPYFKVNTFSNLLKLKPGAQMHFEVHLNFQTFQENVAIDEVGRRVYFCI